MKTFKQFVTETKELDEGLGTVAKVAIKKIGKKISPKVFSKSIDPYFLFQGIVTQICWCIIMYGIGKFIYSLGVKQYEAFGA